MKTNIIDLLKSSRKLVRDSEEYHKIHARHVNEIQRYYNQLETREYRESVSTKNG